MRKIIDTFPIFCPTCKKIKQIRNIKKLGNKKYCSNYCYLHRDPEFKRNCVVCGDSFKIFKNELKKPTRRCCSDGCFAKSRKGIRPSDELIKRRLSWKKNHKYTAETLEKMSNSALNRLEKSNNHWTDTSPELKIKSLLGDLKIKYEHPKRIHRYCVDFYIPSSHTILEVDGCYWHACPTHHKNRFEADKIRIHDAHRQLALETEGYLVIRIWEHDIMESNFDLKDYLCRK